MSTVDISPSSSNSTSLPSFEFPISNNIFSSDVWSTKAKITSLQIASYLTEPICKVREYFYTFYILDKIYSDTAQKVTRAAFLILGIIIFSVLTPFTAPLGAAIRGIVSLLASKPFIYLEKSEVGKKLPINREITLVSHNQCYMPAGYCITDGQVAPTTKERMRANIQKIKELDPDIVCLYEVPDILDADYISSQLSEYPFLIPVAGIRAIGLSSMMYIASKYQIVKDSIEFAPFIKGSELTGRAQYSEKGVLSFDIKSLEEEAPFATIFSTHLQHSEIPEKGKKNDDDVRARSAQMTKIVSKIQEKVALGKAVIFTGDLNHEESELNAFLESHQIDWLRRDPSVEGKFTWGGDKWCAELMGKPSSNPLVLDYTFIAGNAFAIFTKIIKTGYFGLEFRKDATSDHYILFSKIAIG